MGDEAAGWLDYFLPKSAGISPQLLVSHLITGFSYVFSDNHFSARVISSKMGWLCLVFSNLVLHFFLTTHFMAFTLSE